MNKLILWITLILFGALTGAAVVNHGAMGIVQYQLANFAGMQVLADLVIALALFIVWLWHDAQKRGINPWPWIVLTLVAGSFGPLIYLIVRHKDVKSN